ncbi:hypothetical protein PF005_g29547 [Phytophthora fragariae]|uniref:Uncharacterized protein n=2 Tax=Phytophthora fragariae TaxID=53985 RepID=A0A6A3DMS8_9STRA|nr:hypothetical protein PF009_g28645 [Phytophthora fragariae]KAE9165576.1 hypothetical protein PF005_g29547 [Phytophthora fragariae]
MCPVACGTVRVVFFRLSALDPSRVRPTGPIPFHSSIRDSPPTSQNPNGPQDVAPVWTRPAKKNKDGRPRKPRKGWGPYRSVLNERSVAFNLTLDVQNLQQEVDNLSALRDILQTKTLVQHYSPEGSLVRVVKEFYWGFRTAGIVHEVGRKMVLNEQDQKTFLDVIMDTEVDVGNGLSGTVVMMQQMAMYSTFLRTICLTMQSLDVVEAEDSVVISTKAKLRFQILRSTIEGIFPHVMGNEWLVSQLVGKEVEPAMGITFVFNGDGKCCKYSVDLDFVGAFLSIIKDPVVVDMLLGRALIADNCMFGVIDEPREPEEEKPVAINVEQVGGLEEECHSFTEKQSEYRGVSTSGPPRTEDQTRLRAVEDYFVALAKGYDPAVHRGFVWDHFARDSQEKIAERWLSLSNCFSILSFQRKAVASVEYGSQKGTRVIKASAKYMLRITPATIQFVFPHLRDRHQLRNMLIGNVLGVPSQIKLFIQGGSGRIFAIDEHMDFAVSLRKLFAGRQELQVVMLHAKRALESFNLSDSTAINRVEISTSDVEPVDERQKTAATISPRRMIRMSDLLS